MRMHAMHLLTVSCEVYWRTNAVHYKQCFRIVSPCASFRRRCNPTLKRGTLRLGLNRFFSGVALGNIPQCPRKVLPSQATR